MVVLSKGDYVWLPPKKPGEFSVDIGAHVVNLREGQLELEDDDGQRSVLPMSANLKIISKGVIDGAADMIDLSELNEASLLRNLLMRYRQNNIYTYIGSILIAINPYQELPIYGNDYIMKYRGKSLKDLPPHIFAISDVSYREMQSFSTSQTLTISGESGSGKTETTKLILKYLAFLSGQHSWMEQQVLDSNPVLEAFGNAKTIRNDNSSRFGKYIDISFDKEGHIVSGKILQYLLEKSRIVAQDKNERNYHIFYCMLAGLSDKEKSDLYLTPNTTYKYLRKDSMSVPGRNELAEWNTIMGAFKVMQISEAHVKAIMKLLAIFLHFGQVEYIDIKQGTQDAVSVADKVPVEYVGRLLEVDPKLITKALTTKTITAKTSNISTTLNKDSAKDVRDAFVKSVYGQMFEWLVSEINHTISKPVNESEVLHYGILDIFGFENVGTNSFEQLCINYTNERLQQFFIHHVFKLEQHEYDLEGINWSKIQFVDNQGIIDFIANAKLNVFALIDEETIFPKGTDLTFTKKLDQFHGKSKYLKVGTSPNSLEFTISHFAGDIRYSSKNFLEKNRDTFSQDFQEVLQNCANSFIKEIFGDQLSQEQGARKKTLASQFKHSLDDLMLIMTERHPYFVRCIKPNEKKSANEFDRPLIVKQLRYSGMMETIRIRKVGYPIRYPFDYFCGRYYLLLRSNAPIDPNADMKALSKAICSKVLVNNEYQIGKTKVFIKDKANSDLEKARHDVLSENIVGLQAIIRNWACHAIFMKTQAATSIIQSYWRNNSEQRSYAKMRRGFMRLQSMIHSELVSKRYDQMQRNLPALQAYCKLYLVLDYNLKNMKNIIALQNQARHFIALSKLNELRSKANDSEDSIKRRDELERKLARTMGAARAKAEAEKKFEARQREAQEAYSILEQYQGEETERKLDALERIKLKRHQLMSEQDIVDRAFQSVFEQEGETPEEIELELPEFKFSVFAKNNFKDGATPVHIRQYLTTSLLEQENKLYEMGAISCWVMLLRFMGDVPMKKIKSRMKDQTIMEFLEENVASKLLVENNETMEDLVRQNASVTMDVKGLTGANFIPKVETSPFESMQYIIGMGVLVPQLRDEIYCQILKQLSANDNVSSFAKGWILLNMLCAFFFPSDKLIKYVRSFIKGGPSAYSRHTTYNLDRTIKNGTRKQPPSFLESQAMKMRRPLEIVVNAMNDNIVSIYIDSTTVGREAVGSICAKLNVADTMGFGLNASAFGRGELVFDGDHVLDAVTICEKNAIKTGVPFNSVPLRFVLMKIFFPPWTLPSADKNAVNLIYQQLMRGLKYGEYVCADESEHAAYAVQSYFAEVGSKLTLSELEKFMRRMIFNDDFENNRSRRHQMQAFQSAFKEIVPDLKATYGDTEEGRANVRAGMVDSMRYRWPARFSRYFSNVDLSGPALSFDDADLILTWKAMHLLNDGKPIFRFDYPEIVALGPVGPHQTKRNRESFTLSTPLNNYVFSMKHVGQLRDTISDFLDGLKQRSQYAMAIEDYEPEARGKGSLHLLRGDLVYLYKNGDGDIGSNEMLEGENDRNGREGAFPAKSVYIIPTVEKPSAKAMETLSCLAFKDISEYLHGEQMDNTIFPLWQKYAARNIRMSRRGESIIGMQMRRIIYQPDMLKHPLLLKILTDEDSGVPLKALADQALACFHGILSYGALPDKGFGKQLCRDTVDSIFKPCLPLPQTQGHLYLLREEVYCQIMKQMTVCPDQHVYKRMWELMWLITGLFSPRKEFANMLLYFFKSKDNKLAQSCSNRLLKIQRNGERRMPPTIIEIDAIQSKALRMFHEIKLPDDSEQIIEVDCVSKAPDMANKLANTLQLLTPTEYTLLVKTKSEVLSIPDNVFFFDFIRALSDQNLQDRKYKETDEVRFSYQLIFVRMLWINITPGEDVTADVKFHFPQESQKYLRGVYTADVDDAVDIAALLFRARYGENTERFATLTRALNEYVPADLMKKLEPSEWQRRIEESYLDRENLSKDGAKIEVLKILHKFPQFGTTYTQVTQTGNSSFPSKIIIGLSKRGVTILDAATKKELYHAPYTKHMDWRVAKGIFRLALDPKTTLLCETNSENKLQDLIKAYKDLMQVEDEEPSNEHEQYEEHYSSPTPSDPSFIHHEDSSPIPFDTVDRAEYKSLDASAPEDHEDGEPLNIDSRLAELRAQLGARPSPPPVPSDLRQTTPISMESSNVEDTEVYDDEAQTRPSSRQSVKSAPKISLESSQAEEPPSEVDRATGSRRPPPPPIPQVPKFQTESSSINPQPSIEEETTDL